MIAVTLDAPEPVPAIHGADVARIERWAATKRADLTRLTLALRKAEAEATKAEQRLSGDGELGDGTPADVLAVIDARLAKASRAAEEAVESARREATLVLSASAEVASSTLQEAGLDSAEVLRSTWRPPEPTTHLHPPRAAEDLWREVMATVPSDAPTDPSPSATTATRSTTSAAAPREHVAATLVETDEPDGSGGDAAQVYELFWGGVPSERPVRERLRRRTERGAQ